MAIANVFHAQAANADSATTGAVDSTGCSLIVISVVTYSTSGPTVSDSKGNTWTPLTRRGNAGDVNVVGYYCANPTVGSGHTFTSSNTGLGNGLIVTGWSGTASSPLGNEVGSNQQSSIYHATVGDSSLTPPEDNCLVLSCVGVTAAQGSGIAGENGFSLLEFINFNSGVNYGTAQVYKIQTTATTVSGNVADWGAGTQCNAAVESVSFKAGATSTPQYLRPASIISSGSWTASSGTLVTTIDETSADDADYDTTTNLSSDMMEIKFSAGGDPASSSGHKVRYRIKGSGGAGITVALYQGATLIAGPWTHADAPGSFTTYEQTLSSGEANAITDYGDLRLRFVSST